MAFYATTDLHGRKDLYLKMKAMLKEDDVVFFCGDAGDRGPDGWDLIKTIYEDEQFVYIKGNHEDMLVNAMIAYQRKPGSTSRAFKLLCDNGGEKTFQDWQRDGCDYDWIDKLESLPCHKEYTNKDGTLILMSHAGYTPWYDEENPEKITVPDEFEMIWNRDHFYEDWDNEHFPHHIVVHGHTPIPHLANRLLDKREDLSHGAYWYDGSHKVCLDNFSAFSDVACLLNLDTFEEIIVEA